MKSTVLVGTLAATLVSSLHADIFVLGASWRERSLEAPDGVLDRKMRNAANPRAYIVMETATAPNYTSTIIEYRSDRVGGKSYTVTSGFTGFTADMVDDANQSSKRLFGHIYTPLEVADVPNAMMPFSGSVHGSFKPRRLTFDRTVFQSGGALVAGPNAPVAPYVINPGTIFRSIMSGTATNFDVGANNTDDAVLLLTRRLEDAGYVQEAVLPVITAQPVAPATARAGFVTAQTSVSIADFALNPTFQWFKEAGVTDTPVGTNSPDFTIPAGDPGTGTFYVVVSTAAGSVTSNTITVAQPSPVVAQITTQMPATTNIPAGGSTTIAPVVTPTAWPRPTFRWQRINGTSGPLTPVIPITDADGGNQLGLTVVADAANTIRGSGARYQLVVTQANTPVLTLTSTATIVPVPTP